MSKRRRWPANLDADSALRRREPGASTHRPDVRRLRVFAFDPSLGTRVDTVSINRMVLEVPWEELNDWGPVGQYLEVIDYDPASRAFYAPVDLEDPYLLAQDGLAPAEADPQFHQQMVYAVAMTTIDNFERALGRVALWAPRQKRDPQNKFLGEEFVQRLRIYPHALREANAYYSPPRKALLFGYFPSPPDSGLPPGSMVFTALAHDIIAHETTHALLDGMHPRFREATNVDIYALHEGFADLVAIFQRFAHPELLRDQIAKTRGDLGRQSMLGQLAQQFGVAIGQRGALRDALGSVDPATGEWESHQPDPSLLAKTSEPHKRGAILVATVFQAFISVYKARVADLLRIATQGTGVLPEGDIHPDLTTRLAGEASHTAQRVLQMCIRAMDYCPPVDVTFGDYLRAIITADADLSPDDPLHYRVAFVDAFRSWGIFPEGMRTISPEHLIWPSFRDLATPDDVADEVLRPEVESQAFQGKRRMAQAKQSDFRSAIRELLESSSATQASLSVEWDLETDRREAYERMRQNAIVFHDWLTRGHGREFAELFNLVLDSEEAPRSTFRDSEGHPSVEVHSVRTAVRGGPRGSVTTELVVELTQRRRGYHDPEMQRQVDVGEIEPSNDFDFTFRRGCTLLIQPSTFEVRYIIGTRGTVAGDNELNRVRDFYTRENTSNAFYGQPGLEEAGEDFARLHRVGS